MMQVRYLSTLGSWNSTRDGPASHSCQSPIVVAWQPPPEHTLGLHTGLTSLRHTSLMPLPSTLAHHGFSLTGLALMSLLQEAHNSHERSSTQHLEVPTCPPSTSSLSKFKAQWSMPPLPLLRLALPEDEKWGGDSEFGHPEAV